MVVRILLASREQGQAGVNAADVADELTRLELEAGREQVTSAEAKKLLEELANEGFCTHEQGSWIV